MIFAIVGSRKRNDDTAKQLVFNIVQWCMQTYPGCTFVSGGCPDGADYFAELAVAHYGGKIDIRYPLCCRCGERKRSHQCSPAKSRGEFAQENYARNYEVADACDEMIALTDPDDPRKGGTAHAINQASKLGKTLHLYALDGTLETRRFHKL